MMDLEELEPLLQQLDAVVKKLDPAVREAAFRYLLSKVEPSPTPEHMQLPSAVSHERPGERGVQEKKLSMNELLRKLRFSSNPDVAAAVAYFLERLRGATSFTSKGIEAGFKEAKLKLPKNPSDLVLKNVHTGRFRPLDEKARPKTYDLTQTGIDFIEKRLAEVEAASE